MFTIEQVRETSSVFASGNSAHQIEMEGEKRHPGEKQVFISYKAHLWLYIYIYLLEQFLIITYIYQIILLPKFLDLQTHETRGKPYILEVHEI